MGEEIEAKVRLLSPDSLRRLLAERGHRGGKTVRELNRLFDDAHESLRARGAALRVREEFSIDDGRPIRTLVTYKGPRSQSRLKRRPEMEVVVEAAEPLVAILQALGLRESFRYEKRRTAWHAGRCEVVIDELPHLGWFVEVEGPTENAVLECLADLGLAGEPLVRTDYIHLLAEYLAGAGKDTRCAVFGE